MNLKIVDTNQVDKISMVEIIKDQLYITKPTMSGGRFDYDQNKLQYLAEDIQEIIERNNPLNPGDRHSPEIIARYKEAAYNLERTYQMVQRIDWLESCDDGPESFMERWDAEVPPTWEETFASKQSSKPQSIALSDCCEAVAVVAGKPGSTQWYACPQCCQPCDVFIRETTQQHNNHYERTKVPRPPR